MAVGQYASDQQSALQQITEAGEESTYEIVTSTPIPGKRWRSSGATTSSTTVNAVWLGYSEQRIDGTRIKRGDQRVYVAALDLVGINPNPATDYLIRVDGSRWKVEDVDQLQPNEDRILFTLQCRKQNN